ncbi:hypothetical protein V5G28_015450 [Scytonema sp. PRP1]
MLLRSRPKGDGAERPLRDRVSGKGRFPTGGYAIALERIARRFKVDQ